MRLFKCSHFCARRSGAIFLALAALLAAQGGAVRLAGINVNALLEMGLQGVSNAVTSQLNGGSMTSQGAPAAGAGVAGAGANEAAATEPPNPLDALSTADIQAMERASAQLKQRNDNLAVAIEALESSFRPTVERVEAARRQQQLVEAQRANARRKFAGAQSAAAMQALLERATNSAAGGEATSTGIWEAPLIILQPAGLLGDALRGREKAKCAGASREREDKERALAKQLSSELSSVAEMEDRRTEWEDEMAALNEEAQELHEAGVEPGSEVLTKLQEIENKKTELATSLRVLGRLTDEAKKKESPDE